MSGLTSVSGSVLVVADQQSLTDYRHKAALGHAKFKHLFSSRIDRKKYSELLSLSPCSFKGTPSLIHEVRKSSSAQKTYFMLVKK